MLKILLTILVIVLVAVWLIWFKKREKHTAFPKKWKKILNDKVSYYKELDFIDKERFEKEIHYFLNNTRITGVELQINDTDKLLVAASAVIPLFGFPELRYRNISEVLLYKDRFNHDNQTEGNDRNILGKVGSGDMNRLMILSKPALHSGFENETSKSNVGIHEFIHLIDKADGATDGIPESIMAKQYIIPWLDLMHKEIDSIRDHDSDINPYGASSKIEFLSVAAEYFFNQPELFRKKHPELYKMMLRIFNQEDILTNKTD